MVTSDFWAGKRVLITGHTGFKGAWLSLWLAQKGAQLCGISLAPDSTPNLAEQFDLALRMEHHIGDIRTQGLLDSIVATFKPDIVFHLAAQSLVRRSYEDPLGTWATNIMGSAHLLHALRTLENPCAVVSVTTDKVYRNLEWVHPYRETDELGGHDPYSASKAANELLAASWRASFLQGTSTRLATARAGNVIGGGDWAEDRIIPDLMRAAISGDALNIRNPASVRPWQHVLEPLHGYMMLAQALYTSEEQAFQSPFNFGPEISGQRNVGDLVEQANRHWSVACKMPEQLGQPHEANLLALTIDKARSVLDWHPRWDFDTAVAQTVHWYRDVHQGADPAALSARQIESYESAA